MAGVHGRLPRYLPIGLLVLSLLASGPTMAGPPDAPERLSFWIEDGTVPAADGIEWRVRRDILQPDEIPFRVTRGVISVALDGVVRITAPQGYVRVTLTETKTTVPKRRRIPPTIVVYRRASRARNDILCRQDASRNT